MRKEKDWIAAVGEETQRRGRSGSRWLTLGVGDDCAILTPRRGEQLVVTTDFSLENIHFRRDWHSPESAGHRCLARGLSDLAAMGARPEAIFLSLALPPELSGAWSSRFLAGLLALADRHRVPLAGGDTAQSAAPRLARKAGPGKNGGLVVADIVLSGSVPRGKALLRSGAHPGDVLYVTGALGGAAAELQVAGKGRAASKGRSARFPPLRLSAVRFSADGQSHPHFFPEPRLAVGRALLRAGLATAAIDVSDGLSTDLAHLCESSRVRAELEVAALPVDARATLDQALHGGEDYELLFTARPDVKIPASIAGVAVQAIGKIRRRSPGPQIMLRAPDGGRTPLPAGGWEHFRS